LNKNLIYGQLCERQRRLMNGITHTLGGPTLWGTIEWLLTVIKAHWVTSAIVFWGWGITRNLTRNEFNSMFGTLVNRHGKKTIQNAQLLWL